jgi:pimeloyl-ACP methyl ester carboxylesterase
VRDVKVPAGVIEYEQTGSGPPVVLLHGLLMDHTVWDRVLPLLPTGFAYLRPVLPLGAHRQPMKPDADLTLTGQVHLVADFLDALDLDPVTLVHTDWGGALFLTAYGRDTRVARQVILPCEAFDNFPPGLPGKMVALAVRLPGGLQLAARQLRIGWLRRLPLLFGQMARRPLPDDLVRGWTDPLLHDPAIRRDLLKYCRGPFPQTGTDPRYRGAARVHRRSTGAVVTRQQGDATRPRPPPRRTAARRAIRRRPRRVRTVHTGRTGNSRTRDRRLPHLHRPIATVSHRDARSCR